MSLTDDWNTGKLDSGWYFVKIDNQVYPDYYNDYFVQSGDVDGLQVLALCDYDHFSELEKKAKKYDCIKVNGNYPDKISRLKSRIKHLLDLQANQDKEVERLRDENKELIGLRKEVAKEEEIIGKLLNEGNVLAVKNRKLRELLEECDNELKILRTVSLSIASVEAIEECDELLIKINEELK